MKRLAMLCLLLPGCLMDATKLAGFTEPGILYKRSIFGSIRIQATSDVTDGKLDLVRNAETGEMELHVEGTSSASPVVIAEGERAKYLVELRKIEAELLAMQWQVIGNLANSAISAMPGIVAAMNPPELPEPPTIPGQPPPWWPPTMPWPPVMPVNP